MKFRAKAPDQVLREIADLSQRYDAVRFRLVDNIIDMGYIENLFGRLAADHCDLDVFIETKSNLQKRQIKTLAAGGVKCMQPGLESLSLNQLGRWTREPRRCRTLSASSGVSTIT